MTESTRRGAIESSLNEVVDPCSSAAGTPLSIIELGIVDEIDLDDGTVTVTLLPTSITCPFFHNMNEEIIKKLEDYDWVEAVEVTMETTQSWSEDRMATPARDRLSANRQRMRETHDITPYAEEQSR